DYRGGDRGAVAGGVGRGGGVGLARTLTEGVRVVLCLDARQGVRRGVRGGDVVAVPAVGVWHRDRVDGDDRPGLVDAHARRVSRGVASVVSHGTSDGLVAALGADGLRTGAARHSGKRVGAGKGDGDVGVVPAVGVGGGVLGVADGR